MVRICKHKISKPTISYKYPNDNDDKMNENRQMTSFFYLSNFNERKKLNQYFNRYKNTDAVLNDSWKRVLKRKDMLEFNSSFDLTDINFGKRGAIFFSEEVIDYYNAGVDVCTKNGSDYEGEYEDHGYQPIEMDPVDSLKRFISSSFDVDVLTEMKIKCEQRIKYIESLTTNSSHTEVCQDKQNRHHNQSNINVLIPKTKEKKKRIKPTLLSL